MKNQQLKKNLNVGMVGATGMVGQSFIQLLSERKFPVGELRPFASESSKGQTISLDGRQFQLDILKPGCFDGLDLVFFSSGDDISKEWAPEAVRSGAWAVDNSAAFRMDPEVSLVVPEVNGDLLQFSRGPQIIANPNCSTIQLVVALNPLHKKWGIERVHVASYQAVSGAGKPAHDELVGQTQAYLQGETQFQSQNFAHPMVFNCVPQIGSFNSEGFTSEEVKIMKETRKIMRAPSLKVSAFTVRVPVLNAHSEVAWVKFAKNITREQILTEWKNSEGLVISESLNTSNYPTARDVSGKDPVYVGRLHQDLDDPETWMMWIVSDNIRKGAALNGLQIAERIFDI